MKVGRKGPTKLPPELSISAKKANRAPDTRSCEAPRHPVDTFEEYHEPDTRFADRRVAGRSAAGRTPPDNASRPSGPGDDIHGPLVSLGEGGLSGAAGSRWYHPLGGLVRDIEETIGLVRRRSIPTHEGDSDDSPINLDAGVSEGVPVAGSFGGSSGSTSEPTGPEDARHLRFAPATSKPKASSGQSDEDGD